MKLYEILETFDIKDALKFTYENKPPKLKYTHHLFPQIFHFPRKNQIQQMYSE